ncbi:hypothetical protein [Streptomyces parvulus]|uniref:hypothetical protein n=1 Tax=Streptomyces parvulus TaxID=146923 RepID=UPI0036F79CD9
MATVIARRLHMRQFGEDVAHSAPDGFSVQAPVRRAAEGEEKAVATWIKETWPQVERR